MARSIKIGDEITTSILNSVETTITANLLSGGEPNFAACKAVATRLSNYVAACEAHYNELQAQLKAEESKVSAVADLQAQLAELTAKLSELTEPKAPTPAKPTRKQLAAELQELCSCFSGLGRLSEPTVDLRSSSDGSASPTSKS